jgi:hypothetical protein
MCFAFYAENNDFDVGFFFFGRSSVFAINLPGNLHSEEFTLFFRIQTRAKLALTCIAEQHHDSEIQPPGGHNWNQNAP